MGSDPQLVSEDDEMPTEWFDGLPEDASLQRTNSPLKGERYAVSWEWKGENYPTFKAYGDTPEEALQEARRVYAEG